MVATFAKFFFDMLSRRSRDIFPQSLSSRLHSLDPRIQLVGWVGRAVPKLDKSFISETFEIIQFKRQTATRFYVDAIWDYSSRAVLGQKTSSFDYLNHKFRWNCVTESFKKIKADDYFVIEKQVFIAF